jgi:hypothetical protein
MPDSITARLEKLAKALVVFLFLGYDIEPLLLA